MKRVALLFFCVFALFWHVAYADVPEIYIHNQLFSGKTILQDETIYVAADTMSKALGLTFEKKGTAIIIGTPPEQVTDGAVTINGTPFSGKPITKSGVVYLPLKTLVKESGHKYIFNKDTNMIDILPGNSLLSQASVQRMEKAAKFAESQSSELHHLSLDHASGKSFSQQIASLASQYASVLQSPERARYVKQLIDWAATQDKMLAMMQQEQVRISGTFLKSTGQLVQDAQNQSKEEAKQQLEKALNQFSNDLASLFQGFNEAIPKLQNTFQQISPPAEFQGSFNALHQLVDRYSSYIPILDHVVQNLRTRIDPSVLDGMQQELKPLVQQEISDRSRFLDTFKSELAGLH